MIKRHPLLMFFALAFLLSWYPWVISLIRNSGNGGPNPLGVLLAAIIVTAITEGRTGLREFGSRLIRWRVGIQWYALIFLLPFVLCAISAWLIIYFANAVPDFTKLPAAKDLVERFIFIFLFIGLGEEPGWRGFALEKLQNERSPANASILLACVWAFWHLPLMGTEFTLPVIPAFVISLFAATFIQTWIYNNTKHSVLLQMLFHAAVNTIGAGCIFPLFTGVDVIKFWYIYAALWAVSAAIPFLMQRQVRQSLRGVQEQLSR
jgi:membrane protease YdiL (CAAX protease family)